MWQARFLATARKPVGATRALWSGLDAVAAPAFTLITLAALVRTLNASEYGILVIALAAAGLSLAVNPAVAVTTTKFVSELPVRRGERRTVAAVITNSLIAVAVLDLVLFLGTALFNGQLSLWVFGAAVVHYQHAGSVLLLAVTATGIQQIETVLAAALRGLERFKRQAIFEMLSRTVMAAAVTFIAWQTRSLEMILIAQCVVCVVSMLLRAVVLRNLLPDRRLFELSSKKEASTLIRYGGWMWLTALAGVAYTNADRIIVGRSLGAAAAGQYNIYVQITQLIHFIPSSVFAFSFPAFSRLGAKGNAEKSGLAKAYKTYLLAICGVAFAIAVTEMVLWPVLLQFLSGMRSVNSQRRAAALLSLNFLLLACNVAPYYLLLALGHSRLVSVITTASMLVALVLMAMLIPSYGLEGAALARLAYGVGALTLLWRSHLALK